MDRGIIVMRNISSSRYQLVGVEPSGTKSFSGDLRIGFDSLSNNQVQDQEAACVIDLGEDVPTAFCCDLQIGFDFVQHPDSRPESRLRS